MLDSLQRPSPETVAAGVPTPRRSRDWLPTAADAVVPRAAPAPLRVHRSNGELLPEGPACLPVRTVAALLVNVLVLGAVAAFLALAVGPRTGQYRTLTMLTGSMQPELPAGSLVVVTPQPVEDLRPGQVITFHAPTPDRPVVTHRVVSIDRSGTRPSVVTKGDANPAPDDWTATLEGSTVWTARLAVPHVGAVIAASRSPLTQRGVTAVLPVLLLGWGLVWIWRKDTGDA